MFIHRLCDQTMAFENIHGHYICFEDWEQKQLFSVHLGQSCNCLCVSCTSLFTDIEKYVTLPFHLFFSLCIRCYCKTQKLSVSFQENRIFIFGDSVPELNKSKKCATVTFGAIHHSVYFFVQGTLLSQNSSISRFNAMLNACLTFFFLISKYPWAETQTNWGLKCQSHWVALSPFFSAVFLPQWQEG